MVPFSQRSAPFAALGDFNSDGRRDAVLHGHTKSYSVIITLLSLQRGYVAQRVAETLYRDPQSQRYGSENNWEYGLSGFVQLAPRGHLWSPTLGKTLTLGTDGYLTVSWGTASSLYLYRRGRWRYYPVSD